MSKVIKFNGRGEYAHLHPWYPSPIMVDDKVYGCVEQYLAFNLIEDEEHKKKVMDTFDPSRMQYFCSEKCKASKKVDGFDEQYRKLLKRGLKAKYKQNPLLRKLLLSTKEKELVYEAPWDTVYGSGKDGSGKNKLGKYLMDIRSEYSE